MPFLVFFAKLRNYVLFASYFTACVHRILLSFERNIAFKLIEKIFVNERKKFVSKL